jgi:hypothetical protein
VLGMSHGIESVSEPPQRAGADDTRRPRETSAEKDDGDEGQSNDYGTPEMKSCCDHDASILRRVSSRNRSSPHVPPLALYWIVEYVLS